MKKQLKIIEIFMIKKIFILLSEKERLNAVFLIFMMFIGMILETLSIGLIVPTLILLLKGPKGLMEIELLADYSQFILYNSSKG